MTFEERDLVECYLQRIYTNTEKLVEIINSLNQPPKSYQEDLTPLPSPFLRGSPRSTGPCLPLSFTLISPRPSTVTSSIPFTLTSPLPSTITSSLPSPPLPPSPLLISSPFSPSLPSSTCCLPHLLRSNFHLSPSSEIKSMDELISKFKQLKINQHQWKKHSLRILFPHILPLLSQAYKRASKRRKRPRIGLFRL